MIKYKILGGNFPSDLVNRTVTVKYLPGDGGEDCAHWIGPLQSVVLVMAQVLQHL